MQRAARYSEAAPSADDARRWVARAVAWERFVAQVRRGEQGDDEPEAEAAESLTDSPGTQHA